MCYTKVKGEWTLSAHFSVGEAAKLAGVSAETLRHYDRVGLVQPSERDAWTGYRYYSEGEIVRLQTIRLLRSMGLTLEEVREALALDDLAETVAFLDRAERRADERIAELEYAKARIRRAREDYAAKMRSNDRREGMFVRRMESRQVLLSGDMRAPSLENLWRYHARFYDQIAPERRAAYRFEDRAGIYTRDGISNLFAVCIRYPDRSELTELPRGDYLCMDCTQENRAAVLEALVGEVCARDGEAPPFSLQMISVTGILQWSYQIQVPLKGKS